tara:strand:- start:1180 stop:2022 length:843 start_codon:yes stop_codon:yes gene_type:complete
LAKFFKLVAAGAAIALLACQSDSDDRSASQQAAAPAMPSAFELALAKAYVDIAEAEKERYDWVDAGRFADKAEAATRAVPTPPERVEDWNVPDFTRGELQSAREKLMAKLQSGYADANPETAAQLQLYFDCWVEEQEEAWETDAIARCRNGFYRLMGEEDQPVVAQGGPMTTSYLLHFDWDAIRLPEEARAEMQEMAAQLAALGTSYRVTINGHADRSGTSEYNMKLSADRAAFVESVLIQAGLQPDHVDYFAFGESDPAEPTADGVRSFANRRVEIFIE